MLDQGAIHAIVHGLHGAPFDVLGPHRMDQECPGLVLRTFQPHASAVEAVEIGSGATHPLERIHPDGLFERLFPGYDSLWYRLRISGSDGHVWELEDPYRFPKQLTDFDRHLLAEGRHYRTYDRMGAHLMTVEGVAGVHFAVWAPNAERVSVVGDFNRWDGRHHPMQSCSRSGIWELFIPGLEAGALYKFEIRRRDGQIALKADPHAFSAEHPPRSASRVWNLRHDAWDDSEWLNYRAQIDWHKQRLSVYEVHLASWRRVPEQENRWLTYGELADRLVPYVKDLGFTHVELLPIAEYPYDGSWGYQAIGYFAPTSRYGTPDEFAALVERFHQAGIGVILDWTAAHFPRDQHGLACFDGTHLYEHADSRIGEHPEWGTLVFNYGRHEVASFLLSNAVFWADVFHIDGLRVDAVASMLYLDYARENGCWIPNQWGGHENLEAVEFLRQLNDVVHQERPGFLTFAEDSTGWPMVSRPTRAGGLGFDFKWNLEWMHKTLDYVRRDPIYRKYHQDEITYSLLFAFDEDFLLPFSHDDVAHGRGSMLGKMPGDSWQKFANLRLAYAFMYAHPGKKLLFMGAEFGQLREWDYCQSLDWHLLQDPHHYGLLTLVRQLNHLHQTLPPFHELDLSWTGFEWIDFHDSEKSVISFLRRGHNADDYVVCVFNFTPVPLHAYRVGTPTMTPLVEVLNTDASLFGGADVGNHPLLHIDAVPWQNQPYSVVLTLPPLGALYLRSAEAF